jgi:hypothetical protein
MSTITNLILTRIMCGTLTNAVVVWALGTYVRVDHNVDNIRARKVWAPPRSSLLRSLSNFFLDHIYSKQAVNGDA